MEEEERVAALYRDKADELRAIGENMRPSARESLFATARIWDGLAAQAEKRKTAAKMAA